MSTANLYESDYECLYELDLTLCVIAQYRIMFWSDVEGILSADMDGVNGEITTVIPNVTVLALVADPFSKYSVST